MDQVHTIISIEGPALKNIFVNPSKHWGRLKRGGNSVQS
jgi:hypothetical protein